MDWEYGDKFVIKPEHLHNYHSSVSSNEIYTLEYFGDPNYYHFYVKIGEYWALQAIPRNKINEQVNRIDYELY